MSIKRNYNYNAILYAESKKRAYKKPTEEGIGAKGQLTGA